MNSDHLARLLTDFNLGNLISIKETSEGVLNKNYVLKSSIGKFFIKHVREKGMNTLPATALVEELIHKRGIPAICMLSANTGEKFVIYDGTPYSVYPFIESDRSHQYSLEEVAQYPFRDLSMQVSTFDFVYKFF